MMILVLGGGWSGSRVCARDPSKFITTARSEEKVQKLISLGLKAVCFDLQRQETWCNLPPKDSIKAVIITFDVLESDLSQWEALFNQIVPAGCPVICYGTSSVFSPKPVVDETLPLTGVSITGRSLTDRVKGEQWMLARGAVVLQLSGLCSDEDTNAQYPGVGSPRTIKTFLSAGYIKDGYRLVNFIHIDDIYQISMILVDKLLSTESDGDSAVTIRGERFLVSCGAFRIQEFVKALNMDPLPYIVPQGMFVEKNKIISMEKLLAILPDDYQWTLPLMGVEPVSRGLPTAKPHGLAFDQQWKITKDLICGKWEGKSRCYKKGKGENHEIDHDDFIAAMNGKVLPGPDSTEDYQFNVFCIDADTIMWHGTRSSSSIKRTIELNKQNNYFGNRRMFSFPCGVGGWVSNEVRNEKELFVEVNFFYKRARSMIVVSYIYNITTGKHQLNSITNTPFRCGHGCGIPLKPSQHEARGDINTFLQSLQGKQCQKQWIMADDLKLTMCEDPLFQYPTDSIQLFSNANDRLVQLFDDDIVCSIPTEICLGSGCELVFGCFHSNTYAQFVTVTYNEEGKVEKYLCEKWTE